MRPNGSTPSAPALVPPPERKLLPELDVSARKALVDEAAGKSTRQVMRMLAEVDPELVVPADRVWALSGSRWELKAVIDDECQRGLEQLKGLLSHVDPRMTLGQLVGRLVREGLDRHDPGRPPRRSRTRSAPAGAERFGAEAISAGDWPPRRRRRRGNTRIARGRGGAVGVPPALRRRSDGSAGDWQLHVAGEDAGCTRHGRIASRSTFHLSVFGSGQGAVGKVP